MTELEKQLLSVLESLQSSFKEQLDEQRKAQDELLTMFKTVEKSLETTSHNQKILDKQCYQLSEQVSSLTSQVERLSKKL